MRSLAVFLYVLFSLAASAQTPVSGKITDAVSGETISGVLVQIKGQGLGTVSTANGTFEIPNVPIGQVTLEFEHIGYQKLTLSVPGSNRNGLEIKLNAKSQGLAEVTVRGIADGQIKALIDMKKADNIKNIISAEQIVTFPDINAAEVMQRIPGITLQRDQGEGRYVQLRGTPPQFTNFNINGEQVPSPEGDYRYIGMDVIPSDQIQSVEVSKVLTPDMDGDAIGGSVNVKTTDPPKDKPQTSFTVSSGYNHLRKTPNYNLQFSYGQTHKQLGFQINGSYFENNQGSDNIEYSFIKGPFFNSGSQGDSIDNFHVRYREAQFRHYEIKRTRTSVSPTLIYTVNTNNKFYFKGMYNRFVDHEVRRRMVYDLDDPLNASYFLYGGVNHDIKDRTKYQDLITGSLGAEHTFKNWELDYQVFYSMARENEPDRLEAVFENPGQAINIKFENAETDYPRATFPNEENADLVTDWKNYELDELTLEQSQMKETLLTPRFNVKYNYKLIGNHFDGYVKFGAKLRLRNKERDIRSQSFGAYRTTSNLYPGEGDSLNLITAVDDFYTNNLLGQGYELQHMPSAPVIRDFYEFFPQFFIFDRNETKKNTYNADYEYREGIYAAYGMIHQEFNRLMLLAGLRFERTNVSRNQGFAVQLDGNRFHGIDTLNNNRVQDFWLPQIQGKYRINEKMNLRSAITYTYSRPNYRDIIPYRWEDRNELAIGNPNLNYPRSTNFDLMLESYYKRRIFNAGLFYKQITDFVVNYTRFGREGLPGSGNYPVFEFTKPVNGRDAYVFGVEAEAQFKFDKLKSFWKNFGIFANYTYTSSAAYIPKRVAANYAEAVILDVVQDDLSKFFLEDGSERITLPGQAIHSANLSLFYDKGPFFARLSANYQDEYLIELGPDPDLDMYYDEALRLDLTANYQINDKLNIFTQWVNLTNSPLRYYLGEKEVIQKLEFYSFWGRAGVRIKL